MEELPPDEDPSLRLAFAPHAPLDEVSTPAFDSRRLGQVCTLRGAVEDCEHLFVTCSFTSSVWRGASVAPLELSS